jgi:cell surface protein SprA
MFSISSLNLRVTTILCAFLLIASIPSIALSANPNDGLGMRFEAFSTRPHSLVNRAQPPRFSLHGYHPGLRPSFFKGTTQRVDIESLDEFIIVRESVLEEDVNLPIVLTFDEYRMIVQNQSMNESWRQHVISHIVPSEEETRGTGGINLDIPIKIKSKAFQRVFGSGTVGLNVSGDISIQAKIRREDRSEVRTALTRGATTNFNMQQKQRFSVTGKIGDKVTVNVDQDSERAFDFENNIRINYQGYDDEIIQKIEAGNISLSLPGTQYVTFSGKNTGLFGLKSEMVLGNLNFTTIASQEKGESQRISLSGGAEEGSRQMRIDNYVKDTYFFLDSIYRDNYQLFDGEGNHVASNQPILDIEVYKAGTNYQLLYPDQVIRAWVTLSGSTDPQSISEADTSSPIAGISDFGYFLRLEKSDYFLDDKLGYIRLNTSLPQQEVLAVRYRTPSGEVGGVVPGTNTTIFKFIRPKNPQPTYRETWDLAWKNVYSLGGRNISDDGFDLRIYFRPPGSPLQENDDSGNKWIEVFGLDRKDISGGLNPDGTIDFDNNILDLRNGELVFPDLRPFDPVGFFINGTFVPPPNLGDKAAPRIYDSVTLSDVNQDADNFVIEVKSRNRSAEFNLGFNIIQGSEVITLNGEVLQNGRDYTIDYFTGALNILDERASDPAAQLDVSYERNQLFQLEKKTILGMRAEYNLGQNSFLGGTLLYLNESTLDRKVRVGRGPIRNLVWDINTQLSFNPNFIARAFDALPMVRANGETALTFEGEIAQVLPTPNTLNSPGTGDNHGVAYIDDFEGAKKTVSLGILRRNWSRSSMPDTTQLRFFPYSHRNLVNFIWYNPINQVPITDIYPNREISPNTPNVVHILSFELFPDHTRPVEKQWGGILRALSPGLFDQSQTTFIEIMVQGERGRLHVDLGSISEDVIPDGQLNTEDRGLLDGILDEGEDIGIDGIEKPDPPQLNFPREMFVNQPIEQVPYDFWDINRNNFKDPDEPWSYDDWFYDGQFQYIDSLGTSIRSIVGTQGNANDEAGRRTDTEDINGNGIVDRLNSYFTYSFSLAANHPDTSLIVGGNPNPERGTSWKLYRIPFETAIDSLKVGAPSSTQIEYARIWLEVDDPTATDRLIRVNLAEINLVGSDWKERGSTSDSLAFTMFGDTTVAVAQINTHDDPFYATTLREIGVEGEEDRVTGVRAREQSIVLKASELDGRNGDNIGVAQKNLFQPENYQNYERIRMFVYGRNDISSPVRIPSDTSLASPLQYFLRFGADENNYYEYRSSIYEGWNSAKNSMDVRLQELTELISDSTETVRFLTADSSRSIRKRGNPSLTNIKTLVLGIINLDPTQKFTGEVWFNELRLSDVERDKGIAMRVRGNLQIADFATISGDIERRDADFHTVAERFGKGNNSLSGSLNFNISLQNFLPASWGLAMPLSMNFRRRSETPKYFPGRDRLVTDGLSVDELRQVRSINRQSGFNFTFRRQATSNNFFVKNTIDKLSFNIGKTSNYSESPTIVFSSNDAWTGSFDYRLDFGRDNYISIFSWVPNLPLIGKVRATKLYYTPQNLSFRANGSHSVVRSQNRLQNTANQDSAQISENFNYTVDRSGRANMKVFENLVLDITRTHRADMRNHKLYELFTSNPRDLNVTQNFSARYNPTVFSWLNNSFSYSANYALNDNIQQGRTGKSATSGVTRSADFTLRLQQLSRSIFGSGQKRPPRAPGTGGRRPPGTRENPQNELMIFQQEQEEGGGGFSLNPLRLLGGFISKFRDITFNYTERTNVSQFGLAAGQPSLAFQFGLADTTNVGTVDGLATQPLNTSDNRSYRAGSGLALGRAFDIGLSYNHSEAENQTTQISGSYSDNWLRFSGFDLPFPEVNVRITGLEKIPLFSHFFRTVSLSHGFSGQKNITWSGSPDQITQEEVSTNFRPLGKLDLNLNNGITGNVQVNHSITLGRNPRVGSGANRTTRSDISVTASYSKQSGFRLPIWPFNKGELKNSIDFNVTFTKSDVVTERSLTQIDGADKFEVQDSTKRWAFRPSMTYSFSNRVRGGAFFEVGSTDSERSGKTSVQEFGIDVNISIRGN